MSLQVTPPPPPVANAEDVVLPDKLKQAIANAEGPAEPTPEAVLAQSNQNPQDKLSLDRIEKILDTLIPNPDWVSWRDRWGREHRAPLYATLRQQRRLMGLIRMIVEKIAVDPRAAENTSMAELVDYLTGETGIDDLLDVFTLLHEDGIREARQQAENDSIPVEDMVSIEEIFRGVLPFCIAPGKAILRTFAPALQASGLLG